MVTGFYPPDWRELCRELVDANDAHDATGRGMTDVLTRARAALSQPAPEPVGPTDEELNRQFQAWWNDKGSGMPPGKGIDCYEHVRRISRIAWHNGARVARLGNPAPPADGEVAELVAWLRDFADGQRIEGRPVTARRLARAADSHEQRQAAPVPVGDVAEPPAELVEQWYDAARGPRCEQELATQAARWGAAHAVKRQAAPVPVAVSERLPQPEDCYFNPGAEIGSCWCFNPAQALGGLPWWSFEPLEWSEAATHWLPAHALPLPSGEVEA